ncbi:hypothetical protein B0O80DRAFT_498647 [Mortierella sp. GBAus27b]|nr:hypothetical protein B0O80DRAFT_498647 [Mortierella sp. GBAus27b]
MSSIGSVPPCDPARNPADLDPPSTPPSLPSLRLSFSPLFDISPSSSGLHQIESASEHESVRWSSGYTPTDSRHSGPTTSYKHTSMVSTQQLQQLHQLQQLQYNNSVRSLQNLSNSSHSNNMARRTSSPGTTMSEPLVPASRPSFSASRPLVFPGG